MSFIPIQAKLVDDNKHITSPWISFLNLVVNKYNPIITIKLLTKATANVYNLPAAESGSIIDNEGCGAIQTVNLPSAITGLEYRIICSDNFAIRMKPQAGEWVIGAGAAGKYFSLDAVGSSAYLICVNFGSWQVLSSHGTNSFEA